HPDRTGVAGDRERPQELARGPGGVPVGPTYQAENPLTGQAGVTVTGTDRIPRSSGLGLRTGTPAGCKPSVRAMSVSNSTLPSRRASGAPRQRCTADPNAT